MSQATVDVLSKTRVSLQLPTTTPPPPPTKLSLFDAIWIGLPPVQRLFLYRNIDHVPFSTIAGFLKSSLSSTLPHFLPLAGKLAYVPSTGDVDIDFSDSGFAFLEAESDVDLRPLIEDQVHDTEAFRKLVPLLDATELPFWPFSVQVTGFKCGGVAIGYSVHHAVADGIAIWQFVAAWTGNCKAEMNSKPQPRHRLPTFDRELIKHPRAEEIARNFLRTAAPDLPICPQAPGINEGRHQLARRTFVLDAPTIRSLKQRAMLQQQQHSNANDGSRRPPPSSFLALAAHLWTSFVRAKSLKPEESSVFVLLADCRARLDPRLPEGYFGNCVRGVHADAPASALAAEDGLSRARAKLGGSIAEALEDPLGDVDRWLGDFAGVPFERLSSVAGSPRFKAYEADFGFGRPDRVELVSMNRDGEVALVGGKDEGTVQVTVALNRNQMDAYAEAFLSGLSD
ncbi:transferase family protein [Iris pallida]|uniref:Transferase family protein n=1 Tax=Iris pallida TaxID=29817 RepID=A0AAX6DJ15_IRIPA|nr:transferase family protein [Iris pallida]